MVHCHRRNGMQKPYKVGIYCRLSVNDASNSAKARNYIPADEFVSIENQYVFFIKVYEAQRLDRNQVLS